MIHAGAAAGVYELKEMAIETMDCFLRAGQSHLAFAGLENLEEGAHTKLKFAGATLVLTYFTPDFLEWLDE